MLISDQYAAERAVLENWAVGMIDRDNKFVHEFQTTFDSCFWELYLNAALLSWRLKPDYSFQSPDFVVSTPVPFCIEATVAGPEKGGQQPFGYQMEDIPKEFTAFNRASALRLTNSFTGKVARYREYYASLDYCKGLPFIVAICSLDRPGSQFAGSRPAMAAFYGLCFDEAATPPEAQRVISYNVEAVTKQSGAQVPVGLFCDDTYREVSAVIHSSLATWGKVRALATDSTVDAVFSTLHPRRGSRLPEVRATPKNKYHEDLLDGLYVFHNPFAAYPLPAGILSHPRVTEITASPESGILHMSGPDDALLTRSLMSFRTF
jgi:hypothetical protein